MANELTLNVKANYVSGSQNDLLAAALNFSVDLDYDILIHGTVAVQTAESELDLGAMASEWAGWFVGVNRSSSGHIRLRRESGEANIIELSPGEPALFKWASGITAPYVIASANDTILEYMVIA